MLDRMNGIGNKSRLVDDECGEASSCVPDGQLTPCGGSFE
jgi:hypothetical protein